VETANGSRGAHGINAQYNFQNQKVIMIKEFELREILSSGNCPKLDSICREWDIFCEFQYWDKESLLKLESILQLERFCTIQGLLQNLADISLRKLESNRGYLQSHFTSIQSEFRRFCYDEMQNIFRAAFISETKQKYGIKEPPKPFFIFPNLTLKPPKNPGVYFLWNDEQVEYVGRASSLKSRLSKGHHVLNDGHGVSWIELNRKEIINTEYLYIGLLKPKKNIVGSIR
jgi:hypothetical protein